MRYFARSVISRTASIDGALEGETVVGRVIVFLTPRSFVVVVDCWVSVCVSFVPTVPSVYIPLQLPDCSIKTSGACVGVDGDGGVVQAVHFCQGLPSLLSDAEVLLPHLLTLFAY